MNPWKSDVVGSLLRPAYLQAAREQRERDELTAVEFKKIEDLMNVKGFGEKSFLKLKPRLTVSDKATPSGGSGPKV